jgi:glycosyltransferase involved in cell wall biosynthesis
VPVVWRLSDQWPFCGLEHLAEDAAAYTAPLSGDGRDASEWTRQRKDKVYRTLRDLRLVAPTRWMAGEVRRSVLLGARPVETIPTSCDARQFAPLDRAACRQALGLPPDAFIMLVGASSMRTRIKGMDLFAAAASRALRSCGDEARLASRILAFGAEPFDSGELQGLCPIDHLGAVRDRALMRIIYNAADVFVAPSRMENLANTVLESLACGTPAVAFDIGGMPDMIEHGRNGFLARPFDTDALADGLAWARAQRGDAAVRLAAREKVAVEFSLAREIDSYVDLYTRMLADQKARGGLSGVASVAAAKG